jgi:electron transport complex protein RnfA
MNELWSIFIGMALVNNIVLVKFLGLCPFFGVSKRLGTAAGMGVLVTLVMLVAAAAGWLIDSYILQPPGAGYLNIIMYVLVIAALVQAVNVLLKRTSRGLYDALGVYLALITTNCAVLGIVLINNNSGYSLVESLVSALGAGLGFGLVLVVMSAIRERLELADCPRSLKGLPIAFIAAALLVLAFYGLTGMI